MTRLADDLVGYQDEAYASAFLDLVERTRARERAVAPGSSALTLTVARSYHRLLAYKDEYEVARLIFDADARAEIAATATGKVRYHLHPPALRSLGLSRKLTFGPWFDPVLRASPAASASAGPCSTRSGGPRCDAPSAGSRPSTAPGSSACWRRSTAPRSTGPSPSPTSPTSSAATSTSSSPSRRRVQQAVRPRSTRVLNHGS